MIAEVRQDIPVGTSIGSFQFTEKMRLRGVHRFVHVETSFPKEWEGWWLVGEKNDPTGGSIYHESWLRIIV